MFVAILVGFGKHRIWDVQVCLELCSLLYLYERKGCLEFFFYYRLSYRTSPMGLIVWRVRSEGERGPGKRGYCYCWRHTEQENAIHSHTLSYIAKHCHTFQYIVIHCRLPYFARHCHALTYIVIHGHTLPYIAIHCHALPNIVVHCHTLPFNAFHCHTLPNISKHCQRFMFSPPLSPSWC